MMGHRSVAGAALLSLVVLDTLAACGRGRGASAPEDRLVVFAASSLRDAFSALAMDFERARPGVEVAFNFAGTQELRTQLEHGAACDVLASADQRHVDELVRQGRLAAPAVFAHNQLVVVVAPEADALVRALADLPAAARIVVAAPEVPLGAYTLALLDRAAVKHGADFRARVEARVMSRELNARQVLTKVRMGEAQVGIVYLSDAQGAPDLRVIRVPPELAVVADYPIAVTTDATHPALARAWVDLVMSDAGQRALSRAGFRSAGTGG